MAVQNIIISNAPLHSRNLFIYLTHLRFCENRNGKVQKCCTGKPQPEFEEEDVENEVFDRHVRFK